MTEDHDIETAEDAKRAIAEISEAQTRQADAYRTSLVARDEKIDDLKKAVRVLSEQANRAQMEAPGSAAVRDFIYTRDHDKAPMVRWASGQDDLGDWQHGLLDTPTDDSWVCRMQDLVEQRTFVRTMTRGRSHRAGMGTSTRTDRAIDRHLALAPAPLLRLFSDSSATGAEFIPDLLSPRLAEELTMARRTEALFPVWPMEGKELRIPFLTTALRPYKKGPITGDDAAQFTSSTLVSAQRSVTAAGFATRAQLDEDTTEDSIIQGLPLHRRMLVSALTDGIEDCIINGDSAASHQDTIASWDIRSRWGSSGLGTSSDHRTTWLGLRAYAADNSSTVDGSSAETVAGFLSDLATLDSPHGVDGSVAIIVSPEYYLVKMLGFSETLTVDKFGPQAVVKSGQLANLMGMPVILSEFIDKEYNASGIYDNSTKTKTGYLLVNTDRWWMGARRAAIVEVDKDITRGVIDAVSTVRKVFFSLDSTKKNVMWSYNHSVS